MRDWIPVPGTTTGKLVVAALELFGVHGFAPVGVGSIAARAGVTTGSLYHHFGSKAGLYDLVRTDVEQRVLDRLEGASSALEVRTIADLAPVLLVGFDYLSKSGYARLLGEPFPEAADGAARPDRIEQLVSRLVGGDGVPVGPLITAAWQAALLHASAGPEAQSGARSALERLLIGTQEQQ